jgi:HAE1 family hydrophobic/amphiphilic exporter-1
MMLEDRSGSGDPALLTPNLKKFMAASGKRPEIALIVPTCLPDVPQLYVDVDRAKVQQQQVSLADVYTTLQTFMGGSLVNYFNRFGRQWQTYVEAEGDYRTNVDNIGQFMSRARMAARSPSAPSQPCGGRPELSSPHASMNTRPRN